MVPLKVLSIQNWELNKNFLVMIYLIIIIAFIKPTYSNEFKTLPSQTKNNYFT